MIPSSSPPFSTRLMGAVSAHSASFFMRSSTSGCLRIAFAGVITYFGIFFSYAFFSGTTRSDVSTTDCECATRVHIFKKTGVSNSSDSSYASFANASDSAALDGSSIGTLAAMA